MKTPGKVRRAYFLLKWAVEDRRNIISVDDRLKIEGMIKTLRWACDFEPPEESSLGKLFTDLSERLAEYGVVIDTRGNVRNSVDAVTA